MGGLVTALRALCEGASEVLMPMLKNSKSRTALALVISITACASIGHAIAQQPIQWSQQQGPLQVQSACLPGRGVRTVLDRVSKTRVRVQTACIVRDGRTTVVARPFGSEGDRYVCVGECRVVRMCLGQYCYNETVCDPCARVVVVMGN